MNKFLAKKLIWIFLYSLIWLTVPLAFILIPEMQEEREKASNYLTPYSVNVDSYKRKDGTPVRSYNRRPPGSVLHDEPYKQKRSNLLLKIIGLILLNLGSIGCLIYFWRIKIIDFQDNIDDFVSKDILAKIKTDYTNLVYKPKYLRKLNIDMYEITKPIYCDHCKDGITSQEFHYRMSTLGDSLKVCKDCMNKNPIRFKKELNYISWFEKKQFDFTDKFRRTNQDKHPKTIINQNKIEYYFCQSLNEIKKTTPNKV